MHDLSQSRERTRGQAKECAIVSVSLWCSFRTVSAVRKLWFSILAQCVLAHLARRTSSTFRAVSRHPAFVSDLSTLSRFFPVFFAARKEESMFPNMRRGVACVAFVAESQRVVVRRQCCK